MISDRARTSRNLWPAAASPSTRCFPGRTRADGVAEFFARLANSRACRSKWNTTLSPESPSLIRRVASVGEVTNMVVLVCSPQASTGAASRVDGGVVRPIA
jgi:hypothetical protein